MPTDYKFDLISTILFRSFTIGSSMRVNFNWKFLKSRTFSRKTLINAKKILNGNLKKVTIVLLNMRVRNEDQILFSSHISGLEHNPIIFQGWAYVMRSGIAKGKKSN